VVDDREIYGFLNFLNEVSGCRQFTFAVVDDREALRLFLNFLNELSGCGQFTLAVVDDREALRFF
jgi:hypothetical protein